jgi:uncharacterized membrane protein
LPGIWTILHENSSVAFPFSGYLVLPIALLTKGSCPLCTTVLLNILSAYVISQQGNSELSSGTPWLYRIYELLLLC